MPRIKLGIVGAGRLGGFHSDKGAANENVFLAGVYDPSEQARKRIAEKHHIPEFSELGQFLDQIDAVVIAAPSVLHYEIGKICAEAGKHILMEKPVTTSAADARALLELTQKKNLVFQTGHVEQYNPIWHGIEDWLVPFRQKNRKAVVFTNRTSGYTFRSTDVGVVLDLMIHDLELVLSLINSPVVSIEADGFCQLGGHEDSAYADLRFANGSAVHLTASRVEQIPGRKMLIKGEKETINIDFQTFTATRIAPDQEIQNGKFSPGKITAAEAAPLAPVFMKEHYQTETRTCQGVDALSLEMENFCSAILNGTPSRVPAERAVQAVEIADQIIKKII